MQGLLNIFAVRGTSTDATMSSEYSPPRLGISATSQPKGIPRSAPQAWNKWSDLLCLTFQYGRRLNHQDCLYCWCASSSMVFRSVRLHSSPSNDRVLQCWKLSSVRLVLSTEFAHLFHGFLCGRLPPIVPL